jgi:surface polysaccharide O-acyltransferase-like enzyme
LEFRGGEHTISNWLHYFVNEKFHLWYLPVMAGIYILSPVLYAFVHFENGKYVKYAVIMFFVFGICRSTLISILGSESYISIMLNKVTVELCEYTGYYILGYYLMTIYDKKIKLNMLVVILVGSFIFSLTVTQIMSVVKQTPFNCFDSLFSITNFLEAVCLFMIFKGTADYWNGRKKTGTLIMSISKASLGIYLIHPFVFERLDYSLGINSTIFNAFIALPFVTILTFICSYIVITVLKKIPVLNQLC